MRRYGQGVPLARSGRSCTLAEAGDPEEYRETDAPGSRRPNQWSGGRGGAPSPLGDPFPTSAGLLGVSYEPVAFFGGTLRCRIFLEGDSGAADGDDLPRSNLRGKILEGSARPGHEKRPAAPGGTSDR